MSSFPVELAKWLNSTALALAGGLLATSPAISAAGGMTTLHEKAVRLAANAKRTGNMWDRPWMAPAPPWQPGAAVAKGDLCVNGGNIYVCAVGGTTAASGGPTPTTTVSIQDGASVFWTYWRQNQVVTGPYTTQVARANSTAYSLGNQVTDSGLAYACVATAVYTFTVSGVTTSPTNGAVYTNNAQTFYVIYSSISGGSGTVVCTGTGAPASSGTLAKTSGTGDSSVTFSAESTATITAASGSLNSATGNQIVDGGIVWTYLGAVNANPYAGSIPKVTYGSSTPPSPYVNAYGCGFHGLFSAVQAWTIGTGTGYSVGDTVTLAAPGGAIVTAPVLQITSVAGGGVPTGVSIVTPGVLTSLTTGTAYTQASTSGAGTGATFTVGFSEPYWCALNGVMPSTNYDNTAAPGVTYQYTPGAAAVCQQWSQEFLSDADVIYLEFASGPSLYTVSIDDVMYLPGHPIALTGGATNIWAKYDFTAAGGKKIRRYKISSTSGARLAGVAVNSTAGHTVWKPDVKDLVNTVCISDSIWQGTTQGPNIAGNSVSLRLAEELGFRRAWSFTQVGTGYINRGSSPGVSTDNFGSRIAQALAVKPDMVVFMGSTNDDAFAITGATNASPIVLTVGTTQNMATGDPVVVTGVGGNTAANGSWTITVVDATHISLNGSTGNGAYTSGGTFTNNTAVTRAAKATYTALRTGGFKGPIVVFGLWSVNQSGIPATETAVQAAVAQFNDAQTFFIPIYNDPTLPWITGSWNNNPAPSSISAAGNNSASAYIGADNLHPIDPGSMFLARKCAEAIRTSVLPNINT